MAQFSKVFGIGLNRTGTSTLGVALKTMGLRHRPWCPSLLSLHFENRHDRIFRRIAPFQAFDDWPWALMVPELLERYGDRARFILTTRATPQLWLDSLVRHAHNTSGRDSPRTQIYGHENPVGHETHHKDFYDRHIEDVRAAFTAHGLRECLLEVCWDNGDGWAELSKFLDLPEPDQMFPHINASFRHPLIGNHGALRKLVQSA